MSPPRSVDLKRYYFNFKIARGVAAASGTVLPLIPKLKPGSWTEYLLAPLGSVDNVARFLFAVLCVAVTYLVYFFFRGQSRPARKKIFLLLLLIIPVFCLCLYLICCLLFIRKIDIPTLGRSVYVSVGYQRSDFALQTFGSITDEEMLRQRGLEEEEIRKLWTPFSILIARLALFVCWGGFALSLIAGLSLGVLDETEVASR
jgi:hypothetical protein